MKSNLFFIVGIRRSGTSLLMELILKHPQVVDCEFEPHDLWAAIDLNHFDRMKENKNTKDFIKRTIDGFKMNVFLASQDNKWYGAKFALNPGVKALEWVWLKKTFPEAKFIFIRRNGASTWNSYKKQDENSERGLITEQAYFAEIANIWSSYSKCHNSLDIKYEDLLSMPTNMMDLIFRYLGIPPIMSNRSNHIDFQQFIKQPEF